MSNIFSCCRILANHYDRTTDVTNTEQILNSTLTGLVISVSLSLNLLQNI